MNSGLGGLQKAYRLRSPHNIQRTTAPNVASMHPYRNPVATAVVTLGDTADGHVYKLSRWEAAVARVQTGVHTLWQSAHAR